MSDYSAPASAARNAPTLKKPSDKFLEDEPMKNLPPMPGSNGHNPAANGQSNKMKNIQQAQAGEMVISMRRVWEEVDAKRDRIHLGVSSLRYMAWLIIYLVALYYQKNSRDAYRMTEAMKDVLVRAPFRHPTTGVEMTYNDIRSVGDMWAYVEVKFLPTYYDFFWSNSDPKDEYYKNSVLVKNRITHGMRWTQRRGIINECTTTGKYNQFFPFCYSDISEGGRESIVDFGPYYDESKYKYVKHKQRWSEDVDGYVVSFPYNISATKRDLLTLKSDRWIDEATQWWRLDFTTYNPSNHLFAQVMLTLNFDSSGRVRPSSDVVIMRSQVYMETARDYIQIVLEVLTVIGLMIMVLTLVKDYLHFRYEGKEGQWFLAQFWVALEVIQMGLLILCLAYWIVIIADPIRGDISVDLGPMLAADKAGAREVGMDQLSLYGSSISLAPVYSQLRDYFCIQAVCIAVSVFRMLKYFAVNPVFGGLIQTFVIVKMQLVQFIFFICICNVGFAYMGVLMFGEKISEFQTFDSAYFALIGTVLGGGVEYAKMKEANATGAFILYVPFTIFYCFIIMQMVVALLIESYQVQQANRVKLFSYWHQFIFGLARNYSFLRRYAGAENQWRFEGPDSERMHSWLRSWDWDNLDDDVELTEDELFQRLREENVSHEDVAFVFKRYDFCTRARDPPPPEPEVNEMVREVFKQLKVLSDAHAVAQRKLDAILAGQHM